MCTEQLKLTTALKHRKWGTCAGLHHRNPRIHPLLKLYVRAFHLFSPWTSFSLPTLELSFSHLQWNSPVLTTVKEIFCNESMARLWLMLLCINGVLNTRVTVVGWPSSCLPLWPACLTALEPGSSESGFSVSTAAYLNPTNRWVCPFVRLSPAISFLSVSKDLQQKLQTSGLG